MIFFVILVYDSRGILQSKAAILVLVCIGLKLRAYPGHLWLLVHGWSDLGTKQADETLLRDRWRIHHFVCIIHHCLCISWCATESFFISSITFIFNCLGSVSLLRLQTTLVVGFASSGVLVSIHGAGVRGSILLEAGVRLLPLLGRVKLRLCESRLVNAFWSLHQIFHFYFLLSNCRGVWRYSCLRDAGRLVLNMALTRLDQRNAITVIVQRLSNLAITLWRRSPLGQLWCPHDWRFLLGVGQFEFHYRRRVLLIKTCHSG